MNVPAGSDVGERLAALAGQRPWWPLVEPTPRWIRVRIGDELVADSRRALLHVVITEEAEMIPLRWLTPWRPRPG